MYADAWYKVLLEVLDEHVDNGGVGIPGLDEPLVHKPPEALLAFLVHKRVANDGLEVALHGQVYRIRERNN